jgi:hypothetical protein
MEDLVEAMACGEEGATHEYTVRTPTTWKHFHNMSLDISLEDLQGPVHEVVDLSIDFLIPPSSSAPNSGCR